MSGVDFDAMEHYKFWKSVIVLLVGGVVSVATLLVARDIVEARNMIAAGYEYRRIVAQRTVSYTYQWVKIGSPESRETVSDSVEAPKNGH